MSLTQMVQVNSWLNAHQPDQTYSCLHSLDVAYFAGMTWAIHSVVYRDIGDEEQAARYFVSCPASARWH